MDTLAIFFYELVHNLPDTTATNKLFFIEHTLHKMGFDTLLTSDERHSFMCLYNSAIVLVSYKDHPDLQLMTNTIISELIVKYPEELTHLIEFFNNRDY